MSSASSAVTYSSVYTDSEPGRVFWGTDEEISDEGSPRVIVYTYDGLPMQPVAPPSPNYIPSPEEPQTPPVSYDEDKQDEHVLPAEEQPLPPIDSPIVESPGYVAESDPEEYEDNESEDGPVDYPMDGGDDGDDNDGDSFKDDVDHEDEDEEEEKEHLALVDAAVVVPTVEPVSLPKETEPVEGERLLAMPTPPPSPLTSLSPPSAGERLARDDIPEIELPPRKKSCLFALGPRYKVRESSTARLIGGRGIYYGFVSSLDAEARRQGIRKVGYGIKDTWVDPVEAVPEIAPMTLGEVNSRVTELAEIHEHDTHDLYALLKYAHDSRTRISQQEEAYASRDAWAHSIGLSQAVLYEIQTIVSRCMHMQQTEMAELRETDRRRQALMVEILRVMGDMRQEMGDMHASSDGDNRRNVQIARPYFYADFMKCQPFNFKGTEGVVGLTRWIEKMESVFQISGCAIENQKKITDKYYPHSEIKKIEIELWNLKVKGNDVPTYTDHFQELTLICTKFVANKTEKIDKYISRLPDNMYGSVKASKPKTLDETIELANDLWIRNSTPMRKGRLTTKGRLMIHLKTTIANNNTPPRGRMSPRSAIWGRVKGNHIRETCPRHFKRDCPNLKNKDRGNVNAQGWVYAVGNAKKKGNA
uniref:Reverse transcriptase domain-containing protein n=1 Tax=Tanacetum cinerariifolium TaxID=118510 RepID=A0A6L2KKY4_TANCI|nr:hypothetical protein [Tanacetum cinerariifolium]